MPDTPSIRPTKFDRLKFRLLIAKSCERIMNRALVMQESHEFHEVFLITYKALTDFGIKAHHVNLLDLDAQNKGWTFWSASSEAIHPQRIRIPFRDISVMKTLGNFIKRKKNGFQAFSFHKRQKDAFLNHVQKHCPLPSKKYGQLLRFSRMSTGISIAENSALLVIFYNEHGFTDDEALVIEQIAKSFDYAYTRFLDLKKAEAQTREAQIEAALEKIRTRSLAMHKSHEISDVVWTVMQKMTELDIDMNGGVSLATFIPDSKDLLHWYVNPGHPSSPKSMHLPYFKNLVFDEFNEAREKGADWLARVYTCDEKNEYFNYAFEHSDFKHIPKELKTWILEQPTFGYTVVIEKNCCIFLNDYTGKLFTEKENRIFKRFSRVFEQAYIRFLDLKKAEEQARESKIEAALERVRSASMATHQSEDLNQVIATVFNQLNHLGFAAVQSEIVLFDPETQDCEIWPSNETESVLPRSYRIPFTERAFYQFLLNAWKTKTDYHPYQLKGRIKSTYEKWLFTQTEWKAIPKSVQHSMREIKLVYLYGATTMHGILEVASVHPITDEKFDIVRRFANVFEQSYTRFLDLKKAEAQAREAQIEVALEKVRSRTMGMQKSDELKEVIQLVYEQFVHLNIRVEHTGFIMDYKDREDMLIWLADPKGAPAQVAIPYFDSPHWNSFVEAREKGLNFFANHLTFEEKNRFYQQLFTHIPGLPEKAKEHYLSCPGLAISTVLMENVGLYIENFSGIPYSDEENETLMRFGNVFQQTFTRFLDLKKAEEQAREAQIEASLERVRAKTMSMQKSEELSDVLSILFKQFDILDINPAFAHLTLMDHDRDTFQLRLTDTSGDRVMAQQDIDIDAMPVWREAYEQWKESEENAVSIIHYKPEDLPFVLELMKDLISSMPSESRIKAKDYPNGIWTIQGHCIYGYLGINITSEPNEEHEDIVARFAKEFGRIYQRFLDIQKAEEQAREARIETALEKVRSRTMAMRSSDELREAANLLFNEIQALGIPTWSAGYNILSDDNRSAECWMSSEGAIQDPFTLFYQEEASLIAQYDFFQSDENFLIQEISGKELERHYNYMKTIPKIGEVIHQLESAGISLPTHQINHLCKFEQGYLLFITYETVLEAHEIFIKITKVFEITYTRFLDLKRAEEQAREAQIEASLERTRTQSMLMQHSSELNNISKVFHEQLLSLDIPSEFSYVWLPNEENEDHLFWATWSENKDGDTTYRSKACTYPLDKSEPYTAACFAMWESGEPVHVNRILPEETEEFFSTWEELVSEAENLKAALFPDGLYYAEAYMKYGCFGINIRRQLSDPEQEILRRFSIEFERAYTRFLDLQKAEAQAREAQIEAALERVRSRTMAMQSSEELPDAANLLFQQMEALGMSAWSAGYCIWEDDGKAARLWMSSEGVIQPPFKAPLTEDPSFIHFREAHERGKSLWVEEVGGKALADHYKYMRTLPVVGEILDSIIDAGHPLPTLQIFHTAYFTHGFLLFITYEPVPEAHPIFLRFANGFEQTYTRFLDLKQTEHQAHLIRQEKNRLEKTLEELKATQSQLIHAEKMASLGELTAGIAHEIQNPLNFVNNFSEVSNELLEEVQEELDTGNHEEAKEILEDLVQNLQKINHHGHRASSIVKSMLDHSRTGSGEKVETDLNVLCDEYIRLAYHGLRARDKSFNASFELDLAKKLPHVNVIPQELGRVLLNVINNAFYTVDKKMKAKSTPGYEPKVTIKTMKSAVFKGAQGGVRIIIKDNGEGMSKEVLDKIFQPFFTTKPTGQGTGLGMSISYDIVKKGHGGELQVNSDAGKGTEFVIDIPVA